MSNLEMRRSAIISACGLYRYKLERLWDARGPVLAFIMLNPSTADDKVDDPTLRRCIHFAKAWGYGRVIVGNLFAFRSSSPLDLYKAADPVGPLNRQHLQEIALAAHQVVFAWGAHPMAVHGMKSIEGLPWLNPCALGYTKAGDPIHPLARGRNRIPNDARGVPYPIELSCI